MEGVILGSLKTREDFQFQFEVKANAVTLDGVLFPQLADLLASSRVAVEDLLRHESLAGYPREEILQGLECLVASGQVVPMAPGPQAPPSGLSPLNRHLLERDLTEAQGVSLACPEAGGGITLPQGDALILYGLHEAGPEGVAAWIEDWGRRHQRELAAGEGFASLEEQVQARVRHLPLAQLGLSVI
jgi:hypothetical protein